MDADHFREHLKREITAYAEGLRVARDRSAWDAPVSACPGWVIRDLTHHLIEIHYWVLDAIRGKGNTDVTPPPASDNELPEAFATSTALLLEALDQDPDTPCWTFATEQTLRFWQRRQPHEHMIHRWDLKVALGLPTSLDATLAADGIDEVATFFWPRQVAMGRAEQPTEQLAIAATDTAQTWLVGNLTHTSQPVATLTGPAESLLLALWKRVPADHPTLTWSGDQTAGKKLLALKLAP
jgi:uncharacterized protein (TIGR03083 family)